MGYKGVALTIVFVPGYWLFKKCSLDKLGVSYHIFDIIEPQTYFVEASYLIEALGICFRFVCVYS